MAKIDNIEVEIKADASKLKKGTDDASKHLKGFSSSAQGAFSGVSAGAVAAGALIAKAFETAFRAISAQMGDAVKRLDTLNNFPRVMSNLGIGGEAASKSINYLSEKLQGLPTQLDDAASSVQRFTSANGNVEASTKMFLALNNAILAGGTSAETQATALEQLSQAYAKGKPDMMEWRTAMTAMPAQLKQVATAMGYASASDLGEALRSGKVSMDEFMATISEMNSKSVAGFKSFEEQARNSTGGIQTSIVNLKTAITRGLANIMDAIGQSNISGFFNGVASAINTAANYIAAFVRVVLTAINAVRAIFGQSALQFNKTASSANETSSAVESIGTSANDASKDIDETTKSAKKLAKQLAGFDEMNVLKEQSADGGGGDASNGGGGGNIGGFDFGSLDMGNVTDKVQEAYDKLMGMFKGLDLSKWHKALRNFQKGAEKAFQLVVRAGTSAWDNLFKPLLKYIAEDALPDHLNGIGEALQRLNVDSFGRGFDSIFSGLESSLEGIIGIVVSLGNVLSGFFVQLGNIVVPPALSILGTTFQIIGEVLKGIGEGIQFVWVESLQPALDAMAQAFQPIIDHIQSVMEKISECTPLMEAFKAVGQAIGIVVGAAFDIVGKAIMAVVGIILIIIDYFVSLAEWVGEVCNQIGIFFSELGQNIETVWENVCDFIRTIFTPIVNFFRGIIDGVINVFTGAWNALKTGAQGAWNAIKNVFSSVANFFKTIFSNAWTAVKNVFSTGGKIFMGIVDGITNAFKTIVNAIITGINKVVAVPFNAINGILKAVHDVDILGIKPFSWVGTISVPQIPKLAKGGIVDGATIAMIGESGKEAVVPLENNTGWIQKLAQDITEERGDEEPIHITVNVGEDTLIDKVIDGINKNAFLANRGVINI